MQDKPLPGHRGPTEEVVKSRRASRPHGFTLLIGSRNLEREETASKSVGADARALSSSRSRIGAPS